VLCFALIKDEMATLSIGITIKCHRRVKKGLPCDG